MKSLLISSFFFLSGTLFAQDIYQMQHLSETDLTGTARFVGMGGALSALGAEISTMNVNPAGIGLYRHSDVATTLSVINQNKGKKFDGHNPTHVSYDQIGFVYAFNTGDLPVLKFLNFGFNYHKNVNSNMLLNAQNGLVNGASQTWQKADLSTFWRGEDKGTPLSLSGYETFLYEPAYVDDRGHQLYSTYSAANNAYRKWRSGGVQQYDFNLSANLSDRVYLGVTLSAFNVRIHEYSEYMENLLDNQNAYLGNFYLGDDQKTTGDGFSAQFGAIVRPIESSAFRMGFSVSLPTYYSLKRKGYSYLNSSVNMQGTTPWEYGTAVDGFKYNVRTPWKLNVSVGHTVGDFLALGAEYEYSDYGSTKLSYDDYDDWDYDWGETDKDRALNHEASKYLKGVSTLRLGSEIKLVDDVFFRLGYNYVSSPIDKKAYRNQFINSATIDYATSTDYMNLSDINRFSFGFGVKGKHFYGDFAYVFQKQSGDFYAFSTQQGDDLQKNDCLKSKQKLDKHKFMLTLGYRF